jgi:phosphoenolpyruvate carboxykinase (GTP)
VLRWIIDRCEGRVGAVDTPIGHLPRPADLDVKGLDVSPDTLAQLLAVDAAQWREELRDIGVYLESYGERLPARLREEHRKVVAALG